MDHTESMDRASKEYEERAMLLLSKMSNKAGRLSQLNFYLKQLIRPSVGEDEKLL